MAQVSETIRVVVSGVNPQTKNYSILVNTTTGAGVSNPLAISYTGVAAGTDSITAYMDSHSLASNVAEIAWQATNLSIAISPVAMVVYANGSQTAGYIGFPGASVGSITSNSLVINEVIQNYPLSPFCAQNNVSSCGGGYKEIPLFAIQQQNTGQAFASKTAIPGSGSGSTGNPVVVDMTGDFIVATPGTYTFYMQFANVSQSAFWVGGGASVTYTNGNNTGSNPFPANGPNAAFWAANGGTPSSHLALANNVNPGLYGGTRTCYISFPAAGKYPFEAYYNQRNPVQFSGDNNGYWQLTYVAGSGAQYNQEGNRTDTGPTFQPVSVITPPAPGTVGSRQLQLSVASGVATPSSPTTEVELQGTTQFLYLTVTGVPYTTVPYIPVLEGVSGGVFLYDSASPRFDFGGEIYPPLGGVPVTAAAAVAANATSLSGDNTAWTGLFSLPYSGNPPTGFYILSYNGGQVVSGVDVTNLTITADDIAWFDNANGSIDLFTAASGGDLQYPIQVAYMVMPNRAGITVTPSTLQANGTAQTLNVNLPKPMSPEQQGLYGTGNTVNAPTVSTTGGVTVTTPPSPVLNGSGYLTGWTMKVTVPSSSSSGSFQLTFGVTGTLTYLSGNSFVTGTVTYISGASALATIATTGNSYVAPTNFSFVVSGGRTGTAPNYTITGSITLTAVIFSTDNGSFVTAPGSNSFFRVHSATKTAIGAGALVSGPTPVTGGYHTTIAITVASAYAWGTPLSLGYTATDSLSGLSVNYTDSNTYNNGNAAPGGGGGGGGGGGCFTASVEIETPAGLMAFGCFPTDQSFEIVNKTGTHLAMLVVHENYTDEMVVLDGDRLVTVGHGMGVDGLMPAAEKYPDLPRVQFTGTVYNLHILSDDPADKHYVLWNGDVAHNVIKA